MLRLPLQTLLVRLAVKLTLLVPHRMMSLAMRVALVAIFLVKLLAVMKLNLVVRKLLC